MTAHKTSRKIQPRNTNKILSTAQAKTCGSVLMMLISIAGVNQTRAADVTVIRAAELHIGNGNIIHDGMVLIRDGIIVEVGENISIPAGAQTIEIENGSITPGLIDANAAIESLDTYTQSNLQRNLLGKIQGNPREFLHELFMPGHHHEPNTVDCCGSTCKKSLQHVDGKKCKACGFPDEPFAMAVGTRSRLVRTEESSEVVPEVRVIDSVNMYSPDFDRLVRGGVTTVFVAPDSAAVISAQGAIVRTAGPFDARIIRESGAIKAAMGTDPSWRGRGNHLPRRKRVTMHARRPNTRMGVTWIFRKALYDTQRHQQGLEVYGADTPSVAAMKVLERVLSGQTPLRIQARMHHDIVAAIRLTNEFDIPFILEEATEAYRCIDELKANKTPVIYGPIYVNAPGYRARSAEVSQARLHTMKSLLEAGIDTALTAHELRDENGLARQAMYAVRFGVDFADVMRSVTQTPARLLGLEDQIGTIETGKQADLILWNGKPFQATSTPVVVLIQGVTVVDRRDG